MNEIPQWCRNAATHWFDETNANAGRVDSLAAIIARHAPKPAREPVKVHAAAERAKDKYFSNAPAQHQQGKGEQLVQNITDSYAPLVAAIKHYLWTKLDIQAVRVELGKVTGEEE